MSAGLDGSLFFIEWMNECQEETWSVADRQLLIADLVEKLIAIDAAAIQLPRIDNDVDDDDDGDGDSEGPVSEATIQHSSISRSLSNQCKCTYS